ncbi:hypothetical protein GOP47_0003518 [Adiantum capillus-veneris]|uniref:Uncharacterized protein n=1 Tax=Adiantum capillus-veneris TaxID=13818 RepID=A0A9D4VC43_ADICA|nr:hypothetical protein GOP47_0003518 [Adiantum capillus-veneris]
MEEGGLKAIGEDDISHLITVDSPFMKPEFVLDAGAAGQGCSVAPLHEEEMEGEDILTVMQRRMIQDLNERYRHRLVAGQATGTPCSSSRPSSPFVRPPRVIKNEGDDALYVKVEDLPDDVREQVRSMAAESSNIHINSSAQDGHSPSGDVDSRPSKNIPQRKLIPFSEPTRLSAQPTIEEIQMCFAQVDLAILMETRPKKQCKGQHLRPSVPRGAGGCSSNARMAAHYNNRRDRSFPTGSCTHEKSTVMSPSPSPGQHRQCPPGLQEQQQHRYAESESSETSQKYCSFSPLQDLDKADQNLAVGHHPFNLANIQPPSRMQQLLIELANSRRNSAAAAAAIMTIGSDSDQDAEQTSGAPGKAYAEQPTAAPSPSWPPFAVSNDRSSRSSERIQQNFSFLRDDFVRKLEQIQALAAVGPSVTEEVDVRSSNESKRAYQVPVWTHGGTSDGGRLGCQSRWSAGRSHDQECGMSDQSPREAGHLRFVSRERDPDIITDES